MTRPSVPHSTYRLQLNRDFTLRDARSVVDYLAALGVTHCYTSSCLKAGPGSQHGYDICNHQEFNPELGTEADYDAFSDALAARGMGHILDFVPNHMGLDINTNRWWRDVLENGPSSEFAGYFDIDWDPVTPELKGKVLLPILHDQYGAVLERGELRLGFKAGALHLTYLDHDLPIDPGQSPRVFRHAIADAPPSTSNDDPDLREYLTILTALDNLAPATDRDPQRGAGRRREKQVAEERLARLVDRSTETRRRIDAAVADFNGVAGEPSTFDRLHALLEAQPYRLAHWRTAFDEINYRRFFDINELGGLRMEEPRVFEATHRLILRLLAEHRVSGLRLDHADGLFNPAAYFRRLHEAADGVLGTSLYLVIEKILRSDETLPDDWPVNGTTGYGFLNDVSGVFVDAANGARVEEIYAEVTQHRAPFSDEAYRAKRLIMTHSMASELGVLAHALKRIARSDRRSRDFTLNALRRALVEVVACFPVYRTYINRWGFSAADRMTVDFATDLARRRNPAMESSIFLFLRGVLLAEVGAGDGDDVSHLERRSFAMKFQQYTAPVQAKGVEDTAYYRYNVLTSLNEVGGDPRRFGCSVEQFHAANRVRLQQWPLEMIATATHDTKRGEDARARINVLSELPEKWSQAVTAWMRVNTPMRSPVDHDVAPDPIDEYLFYQALLGVWPAEPAEADIPTGAPASLVERVQAFMHKAIKEAKVHTSWVNENVAYEEAVSRFVEGTLRGSTARPFLAAFVPFARRLAAAGMVNSLAQLVLKLASPGVADFYQGTEAWDFHLVDPDNRRPIDFECRRQMLHAQLPWIERAQSPESSSRPCPTCRPKSVASHVADLLANWHDGRIKMFLTGCGLRIRAQEGELILHGDYVPLAADDIGATHLVGFARRLQDKILVAIVPRLTASVLASGQALPVGDMWSSTRITLPLEFAGRVFRNVFTGQTLTPITDERGSALLGAHVFPTCPVALLWSS